jgi:hypothetical protein
MKRLLTALVISFSLCAQSSTPISYPNAYLNTFEAMEAQSVPTSPTVITTRNLIFGGGWIACSTGQSIAMTDGNGVNIMLAGATLSANQAYSLNLFAGVYVSGGFSISAGGSGCKYSAWWRR